VGILNGDNKEKICALDLAFLAAGPYTATYYRDDMNNPAAINVENDVQASREQNVSIMMRSGGGFGCWFEPKEPLSADVPRFKMTICRFRSSAGMGRCTISHYACVLSIIIITRN
jgi:hypothetical protein